MYSSYICIYLLFSAFGFVELKQQTSSQSPQNEGRRKFTHEWQEVGDDEALPRGLHIQINLTTGKKEAKLLDTEESKRTSVAIVEDPEKKTAEDIPVTLEDRLKNIPADELAPTVEEIENVKKKFRPYEELKKEFESLKMSVKTDLEIMDQLFANYQKVMEKHKEHTMEELGNLNILTPLEESHLSILTDLEYMVHQVDNAREFVLSGGLTLMVYPSLNSSSSVIRTEAARLLGSAVQNNAVSQIKAVESGAVGTLLRLLALDSAASVRSAALYALGCLVRRFPLAQLQFVDQGGLAVLTSLFDGESGEQLKLQVKVVTFIDDLLVERQDARLSQLEALSNNETSNERKEAQERLRQYKLVDLDHTLQEQQWCKHLVKLFKRELLSKNALHPTTQDDNPVYVPDLDFVEKMTKAMVSLAEPCKSDFLADPHVEKLILSLIQSLKTLALEEEGESDGYFTSLADQVKVLAVKLGIFHTTHTLPNLL